MKAQTIQGVRNALKNSADQKTLETSQRFFKEGEKALVHGVKAAEVSKIAKEFCWMNQYYAFNTEARNNLRHIYRDLFHSLRKNTHPL